MTLMNQLYRLVLQGFMIKKPTTEEVPDNQVIVETPQKVQ